jgi:hypothetical protein
MTSDGDLRVIDQSQQVANSKDAEDDAGDAQSGCWRVHARILVIALALVSKKRNAAQLILSSAMRLGPGFQR